MSDPLRVSPLKQQEKLRDLLEGMSDELIYPVLVTWSDGGVWPRSRFYKLIEELDVKEDDINA